jgi:hypothetical protein
MHPMDRISKRGMLVEHQDDDVEHRGDHCGVASMRHGDVGDGRALIIGCRFGSGV